MKRICLLLVLVLLLVGCSSDTHDTKVQVTIMEADGCLVSENGIWVTPGENAVFLLDLDRGYSLSDTDYSGSYHTSVKGTRTELTLENIQYPTRITLKLTNRYCTITYDPNGGNGEVQTVTYDTRLHLRPNTSIGTDLFSRDGYTLVGWNTKADGSGDQTGLGSRVSADGSLTLYAQWARWSDDADFSYSVQDTVIIERYHGSDTVIVIPERIEGKPVTHIAAGAFSNCIAQEIIFPITMDVVEAGAFIDCAMETVTLFDNIISVSDSSFVNCPNLTTLRINAIEAPYGYAYRKESCYADKVDLLIQAQGERKLVFYGGCSMWYNLDGYRMNQAFGDQYTVINMGLNGTVNSPVQMQIMAVFLEPEDILFHTPELSSKQQLLIAEGMGEYDDKLWCGLEYNYDLFTLVDLRTVPGAFGSLCHYLSMKNTQTTYRQAYTDEYDQLFWDEYGSIPIYRTDTQEDLPDDVYLDPTFINPNAMDCLKQVYDLYQAKGVRIYLSYACINMDAVPEDQKGNVEMMDTLFRESIEEMDGPVLISCLSDYLFRNEDFYDTNYHLLSKAASANTDLWIRDLRNQFEKEAGQ